MELAYITLSYLLSGLSSTSPAHGYLHDMHLELSRVSVFTLQMWHLKTPQYDRDIQQLIAADNVPIQKTDWCLH